MITKERITKETKITLTLDIHGSGKSSISTGIGFFDHMLESFSKHSLIDLVITCDGDLHVDGHHTVEDVGIVLGQALKEAIYPIECVERFGNSVVVMDEAATSCDIDLSGREYLVWELACEGMIGAFDGELTSEFFRALVHNAKITAHIIGQRGTNKHHIVESAFKAFAVALRRALQVNEKVGVPSTKGVL